MNKTFLAVAGLIIVAITIVSVYFVQTNEESPLIKPPAENSFCNEIKSEQLNRLCLLVSSKKIDSCKNENEYRDLCYELVVKLVDVSEVVCKRIKDNYGRFVCYRELAIRTENIEFCMENQECAKELAVKTGDTGFCEYTYNSNEKQKCLALVFNDRNYCKNIDDEFEKKACIALVPEKLGDCVSDNYYDIDCIIKLADETKNSTICSTFSRENEMFKWKCLVTVSDDTKACEDAESFADICKLFYLKNHLEELLK